MNAEKRTPNKSPRLVLFDFDGTLADSFSAMLRVGNRLAPKYGYKPLNEAEAAALRACGVRQILKTSGLPIRRLPAWIREFRRELRHEVPHMKPHRQLHEALLHLKKKGLRLGIVTSNSPENVDQFLAHSGWTDLFAFRETGSSLFGKHRLIKRLLQQADFSPAESCYVGDEERDVEAARAANVTAVAVTWGFNSRTVLARCRPDHLLEQPEELACLDR